MHMWKVVAVLCNSHVCNDKDGMKLIWKASAFIDASPQFGSLITQGSELVQHFDIKRLASHFKKFWHQEAAISVDSWT